MSISAQRIVPTLCSALVIALTVAAVARPQGQAVKAAGPGPAVAAAPIQAAPSLDRRMVSVKLEWIRSGEDGAKTTESETLKVSVGSMASTIGSVVRSANLLRSTKVRIREAKEGFIFLDVDYDESMANREASSWDRSVSTSLAAKDGDTVLARAFMVKSENGKSAESLFFVTASLLP